MAGARGPEGGPQFAKEIFKQDIPEDLRHVLDQSREISYENYGEKKVISVKYGGKTYKFYQDNREYADWAMDTYDESGKFISSEDIREDADVKYLEKLFWTQEKEEGTEE